MDRKIARCVLCAAAVVVGFVTVQSRSLDESVMRRTLTAEQAARECSGLTISQNEKDAIDQIWIDQAGYGYDRRELDGPTCDALGVPGGEAYAQVSPASDETTSDILVVDCWMAGGGRVIYEVAPDGRYNKTMSPTGRDVTYYNANNTTYEKYVNQVLWPWTKY